MAMVAHGLSSPRLTWSGLRAHSWEMSWLKWACFIKLALFMPHVFLLLPLSLAPKRGLLYSWYCLSCFWSYQSSFGIWEDVLPSYCPLWLSLSSRFLSRIHLTHNDTHLSLSLWWSSCLHTWGKMVAHSLWLCHQHVIKHLNALASCTIIVFMLMIKSS